MDLEKDISFIFTAHQQSLGKVMFSRVFVILFMGGGVPWYQVPYRVGMPGPGPFWGWAGSRYAKYTPVEATLPLPWKVHPPVLTSSGGQ